MLEIVTLPSGQKIEIHPGRRFVRIYLYNALAPRTFTWGYVRKDVDSRRYPPVATATIEVVNQLVEPSHVAAFVEILEYAQRLAVELDERYPLGVEVE